MEGVTAKSNMQLQSVRLSFPFSFMGETVLNADLKSTNSNVMKQLLILKLCED